MTMEEITSSALPEPDGQDTEPAPDGPIPGAHRLEVSADADGGVDAGRDTGRRTRRPRKVVHLTVEQRAAIGKAARAAVPRSSHADWQSHQERPDPVGLLEEQAPSRLPDLVPIRYGRMLTSPFAFYRGGAYLMASDLAGEPRTGLTVQLCGDAHLSNFGAFASPERRLVFSLNDFDETLPGPFEWDVKRLVASFVVASREMGFAASVQASVALTVARTYRETMRTFAASRNMDIWYAHLDIDDLIARYGEQVSGKVVKRFEKNVAKARTKDSTRALAKLTRIVDGEARIIGDAPLIVPIRELTGDLDPRVVEAEMRSVFRTYRRSLPRDRRRLLERFRLVDAARKVVGVGSVGTRAWIVLLLGRDDQDPLFLQFKEAQPSVLEPFLGKSEFSNSGQRVVEGQRLMQATSDILLGWTRITGFDGVSRDFYVRQLWDWKTSGNIEVMDEQRLVVYAQMCGWTLARAHARSGDAVAISAYLGTSDTFDRALVAFGDAYAAQNEKDFAALQAAVADGRVVAAMGL
jgi:uncharacterized protein (DUF2252 family)